MNPDSPPPPSPPPPDPSTTAGAPDAAGTARGSAHATPRGAAKQAAARAIDWLRIRAPGARSAALRFGDWLGAIGWGKFFLLAFLMLVCGGIFSRVFLRGPAVVISDGPDDVPVDVRIVVDDDGGLRIGRPNPQPPPALPTPPVPPGSPTAPRPPGAAAPASPVPPGPTVPAPSASPPLAPGAPLAEGSGKTAARPKGNVRVDGSGVHIVGDKDGRKVEVTIDGRGIRIGETGRSGAPAQTEPGVHDGGGGGASQDPQVEIAADQLDDPEKVQAAVEAARAQIEEIVRDQVDTRVARVRRNYQEEKGDWLMSLVFLAIVALVIVKLVLGSKRRAERQALQASANAAEEGLKRQLVEAQLKMMQAQVEPHFLFNTLASVDHLIETDPARAAKMQKNLIQYLRAALPQMREGSTTLGKEIALCRAYLEILKVRMDDRLQVALTVPQGLQSARFPPMMLQTLVENAIKHGLEPKAEGGALTLSADIANGNLRVTVADTGLGFGAGSRPGTGVGLANVRERLAGLYGGRARLTVEANSPSGTIATIEVPYSIDLGAGPADNAPARESGRSDPSAPGAAAPLPA
jgi:hypothetical protein